MITEEIKEKMRKAFDNVEKEYGELFIQVDVLDIKKKYVTLKIGATNSDGKFILVFGEITVMKGDVVKLNFDDKRFHLSDFIHLTY